MRTETPLQNTLLIGFAGLAYSGKTTAAAHLANHLRNMELPQNHVMYHMIRNIRLESYAGPLKENLRRMGVRKEDHPELYRKLAQIIGESCRAVDNDWWVNLAEEDLPRYGSDYPQIVIFDDVRYQNELDLIKKYNGMVFFVSCSNQRVDLSKELYQHESEQLALNVQSRLMQENENLSRYWEVPEYLSDFSGILDANSQLSVYNEKLLQVARGIVSGYELITEELA